MKKNNVSVVLWITIATFFGKVLGVLKDVLISYYYGSTNMTDAFFLAMSIPTIILGVFTASTDSAIIPQYNRIATNSYRKNADALFSSIVNTLLLICSTACTFIAIFPRFFIKIFALGFDEGTVRYGIIYLRIFAPLGVLHMLYCFFCTYNAAHKENRVRTILAFSTNLIVVFTLLVVHDTQLVALSVAFLVANLFCAVLPILQSRRLGYRHTWKIERHNLEFKHFWQLFLPIMGGALLNDIQQYVDKNLSSNIYGGISSLNYAGKLVNIFDSIFIVGISVVLLPKLSEARYGEKRKEFQKISTGVTKYLLLILIPCFVLMFVLADELIVVIYGRGAFDQDAINIVSMVLKTYAPLIVLMPVQTIFSRFFHALEKNKIPFFLNLLSVLINVGLSVLFMNYFGLAGISFATTFATLIICLIYVEVIRRVIGWDRGEMNICKLLKIIGVTFLVYIVTCFVKGMLSSLWLKIILTGIVWFLLFLLGYFVIARKEMKMIIKWMVQYWNKVTHKLKKKNL